MSSQPGRGAVVLTREPPDNDSLGRLVRAAGFELLEWPAVATEWLAPPGGADGLAEAFERAACVAFTSRRAVTAAGRLLETRGGLAEALKTRRAAAVGPATAIALERAGVSPSVVAEGRGWRELAGHLLAATQVSDRLLLIRSAAAEQGLPETLAAAGRLVEDVRLHGPGSPRPVVIEERPLAVIACASPSAARRILEWNPWTAACAFASIGPTTSKALRETLGIARVVEAAGPSDEELFNAIRAAARQTENT